LKKNVLVVALAFGIFFVSCKKGIETPTEEIATEQMAPEVVDGVVTDTVAPMVEPKDSISKK
jgi:hypothetical protein